MLQFIAGVDDDYISSSLSSSIESIEKSDFKGSISSK